jgi:hypothetical protein
MKKLAEAPNLIVTGLARAVYETKPAGARLHKRFILARELDSFTPGCSYCEKLHGFAPQKGSARLVILTKDPN